MKEKITGSNLFVALIINVFLSSAFFSTHALEMSLAAYKLPAAPVGRGSIRKYSNLWNKGSTKTLNDAS